MGEYTWKISDLAKSSPVWQHPKTSVVIADIAGDIGKEKKKITCSINLVDIFWIFQV